MLDLNHQGRRLRGPELRSVAQIRSDQRYIEQLQCTIMHDVANNSLTVNISNLFLYPKQVHIAIILGFHRLVVLTLNIPFIF